MKSKLLKFDQEHVVALSGSGTEKSADKIEALAQDLSWLDDVSMVSLSRRAPPGPFEEIAVVKRPNIETENPQIMSQANIDHRFFKIYDVDFLAGRNFSPDEEMDFFVNPTDENPVTFTRAILNESAVKWLGFCERRRSHW